MVTSVSTPRRGRKVNALQAFGLLLSFGAVAGIGGLLAAGLVLPAVATTSAVTDTTVTIFDELPDELTQIPLSEKSTILAADGTVLATFYIENRIVVPISEISIDMIHAVIDIEDKRFFDHGGVDLRGMLRALATNAASTESNQGASTLTQQYVKNSLIQAATRITDSVEKAQAIHEATVSSNDVEGWTRKLREAKLAIALEQEMSKEEILQGYLNIASFGANVYGVEAAAQYFFSVAAKDLDYLQAATIAGVTKSPRDYDPERNPEESQGRRDIVLGTMLAEGDITQEQYDTGVATPIADTLKIGKTRLGCMSADTVVAGAGYFCDYVYQTIRQNPAFGETSAERVDQLNRGGLTIHTTLDPRMQELADAAVKNAVPVGDPSGVASAMSVIEPGTGEILAMAQNQVYNPEVGTGQTSVNFNTSKAYGSSNGFPAGSTFKPFTMLEWLKEGHALQEVVDGRVRTWQQNTFNAPCTNLVGDWSPGNSEGTGSLMSVLDATKNSVNNAYVDMAQQLNLCSIFEGAQDLGVYKSNGDDLQVIPANVIGVDEVTPLSMAAAFAAFSADGTFCEPIAITAVENTDGESIEVPSANCQEKISPQIAHAVTYGLSKVWSGTASNIPVLSDGRPASGKTGTTSKNEHTWFVGYTRQLSTAVWVGHPEGTYTMNQQTINGKKYSYGPYGSSIAAPAWRAFMSPASEGMPVETFPAPNSSQVEGVKVTVPSVVGRSQSSAKTTLKNAGFNVRVGQPTYSSVPEGSVARSTPSGGTRAVRGSIVTIQMSLGIDPATIKPPKQDPVPDPGEDGGGKTPSPGKGN